MKFYDRKREKEFLERLFKSDEKKLVVIYGRRRVGKTTLLKETFRDSLYFFVDNRNCGDLLLDFSKRISNAVYQSWEDFLKDLLRRDGIIVFDEFQNFLRSCPYVLSIFQKVWDEVDNSKLLMILCGSYSGMMKRIFTDGKSPLFGRADYMINLKPFRFVDTYRMLKDFGYSFEEIITWYAILGGIPKYLWLLKNKSSVENKLYEIFFDDFAPLKEEGKNLLILEFGKEHPGYFSVLKAIGNFEMDLSEIVSKSGLKPATAMKYISELRDYYGLIREVDNILVRKKRGRRYKISDFFLRFWVRFIYNQHDLMEINPDLAMKNTLKNLPQHIGLVFEDIVLDLLPIFQKNGMLPNITRIGKGWIKSKDNQQVEIDVVAESEENLILIECKWTNKPVTKKDLENFLGKISAVPSKKKKVGMIISKSGFSVHSSSDVLLVGLNRLEKMIYSMES